MAVLSLDRLGEPTIGLLREVARAAGPRVALALVGGTVRDALLGRAGADVDLAVARGALDIARRVADQLGAAAVPLDPERGVARVLVRGRRIDIADFRAPTLAGDLAARDYSVNALGVPLRPLLEAGRAPVLDPTGGVADLGGRRLRLTSEAALVDDPLRGLRGARLEQALDFHLVPASRRAIRARAGTLAAASPERVRDEVLALLALGRAARGFRQLDALGLLPVIVPEVEPMRTTAQPPPHRFPVLEHSLRALAGADRLLGHLGALVPFGEELTGHTRREVAGGVARGEALKLAALLHDVAKPETRRIVRGKVTFFGHDAIGAGRARDIGERLRLPGRVTDLVADLVRHHLRPMHLAHAGRVTPRARYRFFRDLGDDARDLLLLALIDGAAVTGESPLAAWRRGGIVRDLLARREETARVSAAPPLVRGEDVMEHFGIGPGPAVGRLLARAREAQALGLVGTPEQALAFLDSAGPGP
jgi:putative nucleotidyltransferase with HDIG domain